MSIRIPADRRKRVRTKGKPDNTSMTLADLAGAIGDVLSEGLIEPEAVVGLARLNGTFRGICVRGQISDTVLLIWPRGLDLAGEAGRPN